MSMRFNRRSGAESDFDKLANSAKTEGPAVKSALLGALAELFVCDPDPDAAAIERFEDMALQLLPDADPATRARIAARLAVHPRAPLAVIDALLKSDQVCATILLEHCARLSDDQLLDVAMAGDVTQALALARRKGIDPAAVNLLSLRDEDEILLALVENPNVDIKGKLAQRLIAKARHRPRLASLLCARIADTRLLTPLFLHATPAQRREILRDAEFANFTATQIQGVATANPVLVDWILERGKQGLWGLVAHEICRLTGFERHVVDALLADRDGDGLAVLLAAIGCPATKTVRLFLACPPPISHSCERVRTLARIVETMPAHAAYSLVHAIMGTPMDRARPRHITVADPLAFALPGRRARGVAAPQRPPARQTTASVRAS